MPVDFLTAEHQARYRQFSGEPNNEQLARYFHLDDADLAFIFNRRGKHNRLGFALQLTSVRFLGAFLDDLTMVPAKVKRFVGRQVAVYDVSVLANYAKRDNTKWEHAALIREQYGYHEFSNPPWPFRLSRRLFSRAWISNERPTLMFDFAMAWLIQHKVLLPGVTTLIRLISEIRERAANQLWLRLSSLPTDQQKAKLETLLQVPEGHRTSRFDRFRKGPVTISSPAFNEAVERYRDLQAFGMGGLNFSRIPPIRLKSLARHAGMISMHKIAGMTEDKRIAILVAFAKALETIALDEALDLLDLLITNITGEAKKIGQKNRLRSLKDLDKSALTLAAVCTLLIGETHDNQLRKTVFALITKEKLTESIATVNALARPADDKFHNEMVEQYGRVRRFLPHLFNSIVFKAAPAGKITLETFHFLAALGASRQNILKDPPLEIITPPWKRLVIDQEGRVTKRGYTLCFLNKLQDSLRRRDVYVENSDRWGDPRTKLLQGPAWQANRIQVCRALGHPINPQEAITGLVCQLDNTYKRVVANFEGNEAVGLDLSNKHPSLTITNLDKLEEPPSLAQLSRQVNGLLPKVDLTELLLEIHAHTGFADEFTHVSEANARAEDLTTSICAVLLAEACNMGFFAQNREISDDHL